MAGQINLSDLTASGIYTFEIDGSIVIPTQTVIGRLAIGSSRKGLINALSYLTDPTTATAVYGTVDKWLENRGSYFHRFINVMLNEGPVYALNVVPIDILDDNSTPGYMNLDRAYIKTFNTEAAAYNDPEKDTPIKNLYNRQGFWTATPTQLNNVKNTILADPLDFKVLSFANMSKKEVTVIVQKAVISGYDLTVSEWYGLLNNPDIPTYLDQDDMISDFFVDVTIVEGDWTNYAKLATDSKYYKYFNNAGFIGSMLGQFLSLSNINVIVKAQGCLIQEFEDRAGNVIAIDQVVNSLYANTEILCAIDASRLEAMDLTQPAFESADDTTYRLDIIGQGFPEVTPLAGSDVDMIDVLSYYMPASPTMNFTITNTPTNPPFAEVVMGTLGSYTAVIAYEGSALYGLYQSGIINNNDTIPGSGIIQTQYIGVTAGTQTFGSQTLNLIIVAAYTTAGGAQININASHTIGITINSSATVGTTDYTNVVSLTNVLQVVSQTNSQIVLRYMAEVSPTPDLTSFLANVVPKSYLKVVSDARPRMTKILTVAKSVSNSETYYTITTMPAENPADLTNNAFTVYDGIQNYVSTLNGTHLPSFQIRANSLPDGSAERQIEIMDYMFNGSNLAAAVVQNKDLDIRHIVDTYQGEIESSSKYDITMLGAQHGRALVFANEPSMAQFAESTDPSFLDTNMLVSTLYISEGGNSALNPEFLFTLPNDTYQGKPIGSFLIATMPNLIVRDSGINRSIPNAAYLSNLYLRKIKSGNTFSVPAGKKGIITEQEVVGLEYDFTDADRALLEPIGHNLLVRRRGIGVMNYTNNTGYQTVTSALNDAHVRDTLITIENDTEDILFNFLFDYNDELTQIRVSSLLNDYLTSVQAANGLISFGVQFNSSNNTDAIISANAAMVDITVNFPRSIQKFINRITITKVGGGISALATGFVAS